MLTADHYIVDRQVVVVERRNVLHHVKGRANCPGCNVRGNISRGNVRIALHR